VQSVRVQYLTRAGLVFRPLQQCVGMEKKGAEHQKDWAFYMPTITQKDTYKHMKKALLRSPKVYLGNDEGACFHSTGWSKDNTSSCFRTSVSFLSKPIVLFLKQCSQQGVVCYSGRDHQKFVELKIAAPTLTLTSRRYATAYGPIWLASSWDENHTTATFITTFSTFPAAGFHSGGRHPTSFVLPVRLSHASLGGNPRFRGKCVYYLRQAASTR
jgi:hypothetical protein